MSTKFLFDVNYQRGVLALMAQDFGFLGLVAQYLLPTAFDTEVLGWYFVVIRDHFLDYNARPSRAVLRNEVKKAFRKKRLVKKRHFQEVQDIFKILWKPVTDAEYLVDEVHSFLRHQAIKNAMIAGVDMLEKENYAGIEEIMADALQIGRGTMDPGVQYFEDYRERIINREQELLVIPTGMPEVDAALPFGGVREKELALFMAPPGQGKSMALLQIAKAAIVRRRKVALYTFEISEDVYSDRFDSSWSGVSKHSDLKRLFGRLDKMSKQYENSLFIKEFPPSGADVNTLMAHLNYLQNAKDFTADLVIVDYADLMESTKSYRERRFEIGQVMTDLRALGVKLKIPVWSATQANRKALAKRTITIEDLSESFEPAKVADIIIALCQTPEELDAGEMRLFFAKNRSGRARFAVPIETAFHRHQFYRRG